MQLINRAILSAFLVLTVCAPDPDEEKSQIVVTVAPQKYFVQQIGRDRVQVQVLLPPGANPHAFEPRPSQLQMLSDSQLYLRLPMTFEESLLPRIRSSYPQLTMVDTTRGLTLVEETGHGHANPHVWLSARMAKTQARLIFQALAAHDPENKDYYEQNLSEFLSECDALDQDITALLAPHRNKTILVFHPAWEYFARDYGLRMLSLEASSGQTGPGHFMRVIAEARAQGVQHVYTQAEMSPRPVQAMANELSATVVQLSVLSEDWNNNLRETAKTIAAHLSARTVL